MSCNRCRKPVVYFISNATEVFIFYLLKYHMLRYEYLRTFCAHHSIISFCIHCILTIKMEIFASLGITCLVFVDQIPTVNDLHFVINASFLITPLYTVKIVLDAPLLACVASVSVWLRSKEIPRKGTFGIDRARNETRVDSRSSVFSPKSHGNACHAGYPSLINAPI